MTHKTHTGLSDAAIQAADEASVLHPSDTAGVEGILNAAYPIIVADIVQALRDRGDKVDAGIIGPHDAADYIEREFGRSQ